MRLRILQVAGEVLGGAVGQAVAEARGEGIAGVLGAQQPLAHGQCLQACGRNHVACARIDEDLRRWPDAGE